MIEKKNSSINKGTTVILIIAFFFVGFFLGTSKNSANLNQLQATGFDSLGTEFGSIDFTPYWKVWSLLNEKYIGIDEIDSQEKVWGSVSGLVDSMNDPYTTFLRPEESEDFQESLSGKFSGIGAEIGLQDDMITIITPLRNSPADKAGILPGDKILMIDGESTLNMTVDQSIEKIRGKKGTEVSLIIVRNNEETAREIKIIRDTIIIPSIETEIIDDIFVIHFYNFSDNTKIEFEEAIKEFLKTENKKLLIDLRGNPGGYLEVAIDIASLFTEEGKILLIEQYKDKKNKTIYRSRGSSIFASREFPEIGILVNRGSASASEILAGALQDYDLATIYGEATFGKGTVQELIPVTKDTFLKVTISKWLTPNGVSISDGGLTPDVVTKLNIESEDYTHDKQLQEVIDLMSKK